MEGKNRNNRFWTAWIRFRPAAKVQPQAGLDLASLDPAPLLMGWICPAWNLRNRLFLVLSSLCCLLRIWPFERAVSWCTRESCRWAGIRAKSSNTRQSRSCLREQHLRFCLWLTCCRSSVACCVVPSLVSVEAFCWDPKLVSDFSSQFCVQLMLKSSCDFASLHSSVCLTVC